MNPLLDSTGASKPDDESRGLFECFAQADCVRLYRHLHNDNGPTEYIIAFNDAKGAKCYKRAKKLVAVAIPWSLQSTAGKSKKPCAFTPYAGNARGESRWGALDFDAHDGNTERARKFAFAALDYLRAHTTFFLLLEDSGSGGYHVWCIAEEWVPAAEWHGLMQRVADAIGAPVQDGICELRPKSADAKTGSEAYGLRAPGTLNPGTGQCSRIVWHNLDPLVQSLADKEGIQTQREKEKRKSFSILGEVPAEEAPSLYRGSGDEWRWRFAITKPATRHGQLRDLTGHIFFQSGRAVAEANAREQNREKTVSTRASEADHLGEFAELWADSIKTWLAELNDAERCKLDVLATEHERDAFRILRGWQRMARARGEADFAAAAENLGARLGITRNGASGIIRKFMGLGILKRTRNYIPKQLPARYAWLLDVGAPEQPL